MFSELFLRDSTISEPCRRTKQSYWLDANKFKRREQKFIKHVVIDTIYDVKN